MWRVNKDESKFSAARLIAWEYILPYRYIPILSCEEEEVEKLSKFLESMFSKQFLTITIKKFKKKEKDKLKEEIVLNGRRR